VTRWVVLLAACGPAARPAPQPAWHAPSGSVGASSESVSESPPESSTPTGACVGYCGASSSSSSSSGEPTQSIADFVAKNGHLSDNNGTYDFSSRADGCTIELTWDASMSADGSTLHYVSTFDLHLVSSITIEADDQTHKDCIKVFTGNKSVHMQIQANIPGNEPIDTPMDDDSWGVCTDQRPFLDGLSAAVRTAATSCGASVP